MKMFDWDDQELANIWGEGREADDHIVPYPEGIDEKDQLDYGYHDKRTQNEEGTNSKAAEKSSSTSKVLLGEGKPENNDGVPGSRIAVNPQINFPSFSTTNGDDNAIAKRTELEDQVPENQHEDKELGELVGNSWANIGSFDDLDRIFSNDELDGHATLDSADELWSSSRDLISGACKTSPAALDSSSWEFGAIANASPHIELSSAYLDREKASAATSCGKTDTNSSYSGAMIGRHVKQGEHTVHTPALIEEKAVLGTTGESTIDPHAAAKDFASVNKSSDEDDWSKHKRKHEQIVVNTTDSRLSGDVYDTWPSSEANYLQFDRQFTPRTVQNFPAPVPIQPRLPDEAKPMAYQHVTTSYAPYTFGNSSQQYPTRHMLKPTDDEHQSVLSSSEAYRGDIVSLNKCLETTMRPLKMTPQEKIEKLRRRQQMRAFLAIQKQQQQLGQQASNVDYPFSQKSSQEDPVLRMDKNDFDSDESLSTQPFYDPGSPNKRDGVSAVSDVDEYSVEDTVLYQLQDIIARLDTNIRLCMKDSLYRLAHSAIQRHHVNSTSTANIITANDPDVAKEEIRSHDMSAGDANVETETNHIDRVVAHLLFHRPLKRPVRHAETPESSTSNRVSIEQETGPSSLRSGLEAKRCNREINLSTHGSRTPWPFANSSQKDMEDDISATEVKINPQMTQKLAEHAN